MHATGIAHSPPGRAVGFAQRTAGGLPRPFWVLWTATLINRIGMFVEPFLALYLTSARHESLATAGAVLAAYGAGSVPSQPIGGALADRIGRRATLAAGMLANAAALLGLGYASGLVPLVVASVFAGMTVDVYRPASAALVTDLVGPRDRTRAYGLLFWAVNVGYSVAMVAGGALARSGFVPLFWADAVTCAVFALLIWRTGRPAGTNWPGERVPTAPSATRDRAADEAASEAARGGGFRVVLRDPLMVAFTLLTLVTMTVYMQAYTTLPLAVTRSGLSPQAYGLAMAVNGLVIVAVQPFTVAWLGRRDTPRMLAYGIAAMGLGFGLTSLASRTWQYAACVAVWTVGEIFTSSAGPAMVAALAPPGLRGRYNGLFGLAFSIGFLIAPLAGTRLLAHGDAVLWLSCAGACAIAAAAQFMLGPALRRREVSMAGADGSIRSV